MAGRRRAWLIAPYVAALLMLVVGPSLYLARMAVSTRTPLGQVDPTPSLTAFKTLFDPLYAAILARTAFFAILNTVLTVGIAFPLAFWISRLSEKRRNLALAAVLVPFWTSFLVRLLAFMDFLRLKPLGLDLLYSQSGVLAAMAYNYLPYAVLPLFSSLEKLPASLIEASFDLGAGRTRTLFRVIIPQARSGLVAATVFTFIPSLGEFLIPDLVGGGRVFLIGTFLQNQFLTARNWPLGSSALVILVLASLAALYFSRGAFDEEVPS